MIQIRDKSECCGCGTCAVVCPTQCIHMMPDEEGFDYPRVDMQRCKDCGLCEQVCPIHASGSHDARMPAAYVACAKDNELRTRSSSGGIFGVLANRVLQEGGVVIGAAFSDDWRAVHHVCASDADELVSILGSKYLQSSMNDAMAQTKTALKQGKRVLFSGTPCQTAALHSYLGQDYDQLIVVDVLCHGTPSPSVWRGYLAALEEKYGALANHAAFRCKDTGWKRYSLRVNFENGRTYIKDHDRDPYMRMFLKEMILRPSCHACRFKALNHASDLTLGDAWGIDRIMPEVDDDRGTSVILVHSKKGAAMLRENEDALELHLGDPLQLLSSNAGGCSSVPMNPLRHDFFAYAREKGEAAAVQRFGHITPKEWLWYLIRDVKEFMK